MGCLQLNGPMKVIEGLSGIPLVFTHTRGPLKLQLSLLSRNHIQRLVCVCVCVCVMFSMHICLWPFILFLAYMCSQLVISLPSTTLYNCFAEFLATVSYNFLCSWAPELFLLCIFSSLLYLCDGLLHMLQNLIRVSALSRIPCLSFVLPNEFLYLCASSWMCVYHPYDATR